MTWNKGIRSAALVAAVMATTSGAALAADPVTIGQFTALTGTNALVGKDMQRGVELAAERINKGHAVPMNDGNTKKVGPGLLDSRPLKVVVEDDASRPTEAMDAVRKLVNVDKVPVVLGEYSSSVTLPTGQFTNANKVVQISTGANAPALADIGPYFFSMIGLGSLEGKPLLELAQKVNDAKKVATVMPNNPFGVGLEEGTCSAAKSLGMECVARVRFDLGKSDYRAELKQASAPKPDAYIFFAYGTEAPLLIRQADELKLDTAGKWLGAEMSSWAQLLIDEKMGDGMKGLDMDVSSDFYDKEYASAYEEKYGEKPLSAFGGYAYDAMMVTALAIEAAGSDKADAIKDALPAAAKAYKGVTGDKAMDDKGMQVDEAYAYFQIKDGELVPFK